MSESKTAAKSAVKEKFEKIVISDEELIRQLRIDRESALWPGTQKIDALLREYDAFRERAGKHIAELNDKLEAAKDRASRLEFPDATGQ